MRPVPPRKPTPDPIGDVALVGGITLGAVALIVGSVLMTRAFGWQDNDANLWLLIGGVVLLALGAGATQFIQQWAARRRAIRDLEEHRRAEREKAGPQ